MVSKLHKSVCILSSVAILMGSSLALAQSTNSNTQAHKVEKSEPTKTVTSPAAKPETQKQEKPAVQKPAKHEPQQTDNHRRDEWAATGVFSLALAFVSAVSYNAAPIVQFGYHHKGKLMIGFGILSMLTIATETVAQVLTEKPFVSKNVEHLTNTIVAPVAKEIGQGGVFFTRKAVTGFHILAKSTSNIAHAGSRLALAPVNALAEGFMAACAENSMTVNMTVGIVSAELAVAIALPFAVKHGARLVKLK